MAVFKYFQERNIRLRKKPDFAPGMRLSAPEPSRDVRRIRRGIQGQVRGQGGRSAGHGVSEHTSVMVVGVSMCGGVTTPQ